VYASRRQPGAVEMAQCLRVVVGVTQGSVYVRVASFGMNSLGWGVNWVTGFAVYVMLLPPS